eukprot:SAG22_NODE_8750_length_632_cov_1.829268_1_plen_67_part_10
MAPPLPRHLPSHLHNVMATQTLPLSPAGRADGVLRVGMPEDQAAAGEGIYVGGVHLLATADTDVVAA